MLTLVRLSTFLADRLGPLTILLCASLALATWYRGQQLVWGEDATHPMNLSDVSRYFHIPDAGLGAPDARKLPFLLPLGAVLSLWRELGVPYDLTFVQPLVVVALLTIAGWSSYFLIRTLLPAVGAFAAVAGSLVYMFNLYSLTTVWSAMSYLNFHYAFLPLVLAVWMLVLTRRVSLWLVPPAAALWALTLTPAYIATPVVVTDTLLFGGVAIFAVATRGRAHALRAIGRATLLFGTWLTLSLFWIIPFVAFASVETTRGIAVGSPRALFELNSAPFFEAIRLAGYWGASGTYAGSPYFPWYRYFADIGVHAALALPVLGLIGIAGAARSRQALDTTRSPYHGSGPSSQAHFAFFVVMLVTSLVLMSGANEPFGALKEWAVETFGLAGPFRSVYQRFGVYAALAYAPLVAVGMFVLQSAVRVRAGRAPAIAVALAATIAVAVLPALPLWTGAAFDRSGINPSRRITVPNDYRRLAAILDSTPGDFNVLVLPYGGVQGISVFEWRNGEEGYLGVEPLGLLTRKPVLTSDSTAPYLKSLVENVLSGVEAPESLRLLNTRFIVLHEDASIRYLENRPGWIGLDIDLSDDRIERLPNTHLIFATDKLRAYSWVGWVPHRFFAIRESSVVSGPSRETGSIHADSRDQSAVSTRVARRAVPYTVDSVSRFTVDTSALRAGELLVLNQPFDSSWRADGVKPIRITPGLTAFKVGRRGLIRVQHARDRQFMQLLVIVPLGLVACAGSLARGIVVTRRRRRVEHR